MENKTKKESQFTSAKSNEILMSRLKNLLWIWPCIGVLFFVTPTLDIFSLKMNLLGLPFRFVLLFCVWAFLIFGMFLINRYMNKLTGSRDL